MNEKKYSALRTLLACYFHQDMDLDYSNEEEALKDYVFKTGNEYINSALNDIDILKSERLDIETLWDKIGRLGCEYRYDEYTPEEWLDYVSDTIKKYLVQKQKLEKSQSETDTNQTKPASS